MVSNLTSINQRRTKRTAAALTLVELLVSMAVGSFIVLAVVSFFVFSGRSFVAFSSYVDLDLANQKAMDQMTKDFRGVWSVTDYSTNAVTFKDFDGKDLKYTYDPDKRTLTRQKQSVKTVLLRECDLFTVNLEQRNLVAGTFTNYAATNIAETKAIAVNWNCSYSLAGRKISQTTQMARAVIRAPEGTFYDGTSTTSGTVPSGGGGSGKGGGVGKGKK